MPLMSTCLGRLGSRFSLILDPHRCEVHYGALGLMCQQVGELVVGLDDGQGTFHTLPLSKQGEPFTIVDQQLTMTSVVYEAHSVALGVSLRAELVAPFWPQDEATSTVPAYVLNCRIARLDRVRWTGASPDATRRGVLRVALRLPDATVAPRDDALELRYHVAVGQRARTGEGARERELRGGGRTAPVEGQSTDLLVPLEGHWAVRGDALEAAYDVSDGADAELSLALVAYCDAPLFEGHRRPMKLKYATRWPNAAAVADFVRQSHAALCETSHAFDSLWAASSLPAAAQDLSALSFQSYLMNTLWTVDDDGAEWFSVWEGSCWYNSTVDVTYNEALFYFACWPRLLELIFDEWQHHANDAEAERQRLAALPEGHRGQHAGDELHFPGCVLEHDMGSGWTANGQSYHHAMP
ncbi:hypothetical protein HQ576_07800, partial [bacterium]|nr:hypothetical protein [bacterium]